MTVDLPQLDALAVDELLLVSNPDYPEVWFYELVDGEVRRYHSQFGFEADSVPTREEVRSSISSEATDVTVVDRETLRQHQRQTLTTDGGTQVIKRELPIEECLNGKTRDESNLDDDAIEDFVAWSKDIKRSEVLRELARERLDEDDLPRADSLLWVDQAEVYALCSGCYYENSDGAWTGSTQNPNYEELRSTMNERLADGCPCAFCKSDRISELKDEIGEEVDVEIEVVE